MGLLTHQDIVSESFTTRAFLFVAFLQIALPASVLSGPYPPAAGEPGSAAVSKGDPAIIAWATGWENYLVGEEVSETWQNPHKALGPAEGTFFDIVSLGRGGEIMLTFDWPIRNGEGWDLAVFENSFNDTFLELAYVEVSSDGTHFLRFDNDSLTADPVGGFGAIDPTDVYGLAGKYRQGFGTPFDLRDLATKEAVLNGTVNLSRITHLRIVDIVGDGSCVDTSGDVIFDPYPTVQSAGFDLDAVGIRYENTTPQNSAPDPPVLSAPPNEATDVSLTPTLETEPFSDPDEDDVHLMTTWQISKASDFSNLLFEATSSALLTELTIPRLLLKAGETYYWHAKFYDGAALDSDWSELHMFQTVDLFDDENANGIPDDQELGVGSTVDLNNDGMDDVSQIDDQFKVFNTVMGEGQIAVEAPAGVIIERVESMDPDGIADITSKPDSIPLGLVGLILKVPNPGNKVTVIVYLSEASQENARWHRHDSIRGWSEYPNATFSQDRRSVTLEFQDGAHGDADGAENTWIVDASGVGSFVSPEPPESGKGGVSGNGCFVSTLLCQ
ncbi:MAG: choice-of-anchor U domain-containing protein [Thermodesulfobacteriota bacterium]|nr:choice-of-anchor U domain-containing protein [Thermodesulfobacteriota bacterium]